MSERTETEIKDEMQEYRCYLIKHREYALMDIYEDKKFQNLQKELKDVIEKKSSK